MQLGVGKRGQQPETPHPRQQSRSQSERDHISERIQLTAEIATCLGHARDASIQSIEQNREPDRLGRIIQVPGLGYGRVRDLKDRIVSCRYIQSGKQGWQDVHPFA